jgi:hypothetical protein
MVPFNIFGVTFSNASEKKEQVLYDVMDGMTRATLIRKYNLDKAEARSAVSAKIKIMQAVQSLNSASVDEVQLVVANEYGTRNEYMQYVINHLVASAMPDIDPNSANFSSIKIKHNKIKGVYEFIMEEKEMPKAKVTRARVDPVQLFAVLTLNRDYNINYTTLHRSFGMDRKTILRYVNANADLTIDGIAKKLALTEDQIAEANKIVEEYDFDNAVQVGYGSITNKDIYAIIAMRNAGYTVSSICDHTGKCDDSVVKIIKTYEGHSEARLIRVLNVSKDTINEYNSIDKNANKLKSTAALLKQEVYKLILMRNTGCTLRSISNLTGYSLSTVNRYCNKYAGMSNEEVAKELGLNKRQTNKIFNDVNKQLKSAQNKSDNQIEPEKKDEPKTEIQDSNEKIVQAEVPTVQETVTEEVKQDAEVEEKSPAITSITNTVTFKCGLCSDRHDMPVTDYIYPTLSRYQMYDYDWQCRKAYSYLKSNVINYEANVNNAVELYVTGMSSCLAAVIKVCHDLNINLVLKHYHAEIGKYESQQIWGDELYIKLHPCAAYIAQRYNATYAYKCDMQNYKGDTIYTVVDLTYDKPAGSNKRSMKRKEAYIATSIQDAYELYWELQKKLVGAKTDKTICVYSYTAYTSSDGSTHIRHGDLIVRASNF